MGGVDGLGGYDWAAWLGLAVVLGIVEVTTLDLTFAMLAVGALAGAATGLFVDNLVIEALVALAVAVGMLVVVRPIALRHLRTPLAIRTGTDALTGSTGLVLEPVDAHGGRVKVRGEVWSARSFDPSVSIEAGRNVEIVQIDGATVIVYESEI
jgi:membrane protein implicated in regulation of membrane protease activity